MSLTDILLVIVFWFIGLFLREYIYRFMRNFRDKLRK